MKKNFTLSIFFCLSFSIFAQNTELSNKLIEQYRNGQLKATTKSASIHNHLWLTPILNEVVRNWNDLTEEAKSVFSKFEEGRPTFTGTELTSESGNFLFHYTTDGGAGESVDPKDDDANGIPDFIDNMMAKFNAMYTLYHTTTHLTVPPSDGTNGGNAKYDIYVSGDIAGEGTYGYVSPEDSIGDNSNSSTLTEVNAYASYMVIIMTVSAMKMLL